MGMMNDVAVAESTLPGLVDEAAATDAHAARDAAFAAGTVIGWHRRRASEIDASILKDWRAFAKAKPFWKPDRADDTRDAD
jgi:hypothetical protein